MARYRLTIAYDGTNFHGWQRQEPLAGAPHADPSLTPARPGRVALRTVQAVLQEAVARTVRHPVEVVGASRTDAGVHALGQVAAFSSSRTAPGRGWPEDRGTEPLRRALNARLPDDVLVRRCETVPDDFDPIAHCTSKAYSYTLHVSPNRPLWDRHRVMHLWTPLDVHAMADAAAILVGEHDFAAFAAAGHGRASTVRTILACSVSSAPLDDAPWAARVRIDVAGTGFLYNMVRIIAGTLVDVGRGRRTPADIRLALHSGDRTRAGPTLPPQGLCLQWVRYDHTDNHPCASSTSPHD